MEPPRWDAVPPEVPPPEAAGGGGLAPPPPLAARVGPPPLPVAAIPVYAPAPPALLPPAALPPATIGGSPPPVPGQKPPRLFSRAAILLVAALFALIAGAIIWAVRRDKWGHLPPHEDSVETRHQEASAAFTAGGAAPSDSDAAAIKATLNQLGTSLKQSNSWSISQSFDFDRMADEINRLRPPRRGKSQAWNHTGENLRAEVPRTLAADGANSGWDACDLRLVRRLKVPSGRDPEAVAYVRLHHAAGVRSKQRYWLRMTNGRWRVYDYEHLDLGWRYTDAARDTAEAYAAGNVAQHQAAEIAVLAALDNVRKQDLAQAEVNLFKVANLPMTGQLDALRQYASGALRVYQYRATEALAFHDQVLKSSADVPAVHLSRAAALSQLGQYDEALAAVDRYEQALGTDAGSFELRGDALRALDRLPEAAAAYRKGLADDPDSTSNLAGLARALPKGGKGELGAHLARATDRRAAFAAVAGAAAADWDADALAVYVAAYRGMAASQSDPYLDLYDGKEKLIRGRHAEAAKVFESLRGSMPAPGQPELEQDLITALLGSGRPADAYRAASDRSEGFSRAAGYLSAKKDVSALRALIGLHRQSVPWDAQLYYFEGVGWELERQPEKAAESFAKALNWAPAESRGHYRYRALSAYFAAGKAVEAYRRFGTDAETKKQTFVELANLASGKENVAVLKELLSTYRKEAPDDRVLPLWDAELLFRGGDPAGAADLLARHRESLAHAEDTQWRFYDRLVRSLVRAGRLKEAVREAELQEDSDNGDASLVALAYAAAGNTPRAVGAMERYVQAGDEDAEEMAAELYADEDLGPLLRSEAFTAWREKHPPPSTQPATTRATDAAP